MRVAADHPALAGHFPGNPVVPGVVILEQLVQVLRQQMGELRVTALPSVKFLAPMVPDQDYDVVFTEKQPGHLGFAITKLEQQIATGSIHYESKSATTGLDSF